MRKVDNLTTLWAPRAFNGTDLPLSSNSVIVQVVNHNIATFVCRLALIATLACPFVP